LYSPDFILFYLLEASNDLVEGYATANSDKVQLDEVYTSCWFDVDIANKLVAVNNSCCIVCFVTYNAEVKDTTTTLNISEEWFYECHELASCKLIVELKEA
jgi:hypothetical protein